MKARALKARITRNDYGYPTAIAIGDWVIVHLNQDTRTDYCCDALVDALNMLPKRVREQLLQMAMMEGSMPMESRLSVAPRLDRPSRKRPKRVSTLKRGALNRLERRVAQAAKKVRQ
jgi:hypothetical protein